MGDFIQGGQSKLVAPGSSGRNNKQVGWNNTFVFEASMTRANSVDPKHKDFFAVGGTGMKNGVEKGSNDCFLKTARIPEEDG
jgi:hypothetical protein